MKSVKILSLVLALVMLVACFAACGGPSDVTEPPVDTKPQVNTPVEGGSLTDTANRDAVKDNVPEGLDFSSQSDNTVTFFTRDNQDTFKYEMDAEKTVNDTLIDAVFYRNDAVEDRLGVVIEQVQQNGAWEVIDSWNQTMRNAVLTKSGDYDAAAIYASAGSALAVEGLYYNVLDVPYIELSKPWWNKSIINETELFNTVYFLAGDIAISEVAWGVTLFYNKNLMNELYATEEIDLYQIVRDDKWTVDEMYKLTSNAWIDTNSDGVLNSGDTFGFRYADSSGDGAMDAWIAAMGIDITTMVDGYPELTFYNEHTVEAYEKLKTLHLGNPGTLVETNHNSVADFIAGNQLFTRGFIHSGQELRAMNDDYGILPLPKFDEEQEEYRTLSSNLSSLVVVLSTVTDLEMVGSTLELMAAESYKQVTPAFFDIVLKGKYSDAPQDAEMYDLILNSFTYNFGFCFSTKSIEGIGSLFRVLSDDLSQRYESNKIKYQTALDALVDKLDEISFMS